jgi:hypothetical protein
VHQCARYGSSPRARVPSVAPASHEGFFWTCGGRPSHWTLTRAYRRWPNLCCYINILMSLPGRSSRSQRNGPRTAHLTWRDESNINVPGLSQRAAAAIDQECGYRGAVCLDPYKGTRLRQRSQRAQSLGYMLCTGRAAYPGIPHPDSSIGPARCEMTSSLANCAPACGASAERYCVQNVMASRCVLASSMWD